MPSNKRIWAAKVGYIIISILIGVLGIVLIAVPNFSVSLLCRLGGGILILFGIVKIIGYCSNDLYRLAFQYDLAIGILLIALGAILILRTRIMTSLICVLLGIYTLADALLKIQISVDSKAFGICQWWLILVVAIITGVSRAVRTSCELIGVRSLPSQTMRTGFRPPSIRQVRAGSSASTVPTPHMMPRYLLRRRCTCTRAAGPVIHLDSPVYAAIFPSRVMAYLSATKGALCVM